MTGREPLDFLSFLDRLAADERVAPVPPLHHYLVMFPGIEEMVAREYLSRLDAARNHAADGPGSGPGGTVMGCVGPFLVQRELGHGGQGTVYLAKDTRIGRQVALKVLAPQTVVDGAARARFRREAKAIALLDHPSLCKILEADLEGDRPYIAMQFVRGETLRARLRRARESDPPALPDSRSLPALLRLFERTARAVHSAHEHGLVHRDIKPGNIQLSEDGTPVVLDFGLVRFTSRGRDSETLTVPGEGFGTPQYMAPEQLRNDRPVDRRADVWSLGVMLYEAATLALPRSRDANPARPEETPSTDPRTLNPAIGDELRIVIETAMAVEPSRRYPTALAFAEDLRRICDFEPIVARQASAWLRTRRWCRRHVRVLAVATGVSMVLSLVGADWVGRKIVAATSAAREDALLIRSQTLTKPQTTLATALASASLSPGDHANTTALAALRNDHQLWVTRGPLPGRGRANGLRHTLCVTARHVAVATTRSGVAVHDALTGACVADVEGESEVSSIASVGDGFVFCWSDGSMRRWSETAGMEPLVLAAPAITGDRVLSITAMPGRADLLLLVTRGRKLVLWNEREQRQEFEVLHAGSNQDHLTAFVSADGTMFATGSGRAHDAGGQVEPVTRSVRVWDDRGRLLCELDAPRSRLNWCDFSTDGRHVALVYVDGTVEAWRLPDGAGPGMLRRTWSHRFGIEAYQCRFHPDGSHIVVSLGISHSADPDPTVAAPIRAFDTATGAEVARYSGHEFAGVQAIAFGPDGRQLASVGNDCQIVIWEATPSPPAVRGQKTAVTIAPRGFLRSLTAKGSSLRWLPDCRHVVVIAEDGRLSCWDTQQPWLRVLRHSSPLSGVCFQGDSTHVATATTIGTVALWNRERGTIVRTILEAGEPVRFLEFTPDGHHLVILSGDQRVVVVATDSWLASTYLMPVKASGVAIDPGSRRVAVGLTSGGTSLIEFGDATPKQLAGGCIQKLAFALDGRSLLVAQVDGLAVAWDPTTRSEITRAWTSPLDLETGRQTGFSVALAIPGGGWLLATASKRLRLDGRLETLDSKEKPRITRAAYHPAGSLLVCGHNWGAFSLWKDREYLGAEGIDGRPTSVLRFSASGRFFVAASYGGLARLYAAGDYDRPWCELQHGSAVLTVDISPDENWVVTGTLDGTAWIWPTEPIEFARMVDEDRNLPSSGR